MRSQRPAGFLQQGENIVVATNAAPANLLQSVLVNYLASQARTVEGSVNRALRAVLERNERFANEVFLTEPRINEMEIVIDEHAVRMLRSGNLAETEIDRKSVV